MPDPINYADSRTKAARPPETPDIIVGKVALALIGIMVLTVLAVAGLLMLPRVLSSY